MLIFFLISAVLVIGAVSILSSAKEEELNPKNNPSKGIVLEPKLSEQDIKAFSRKHKLVKNPAALI